MEQTHEQVVTTTTRTEAAPLSPSMESRVVAPPTQTTQTIEQVTLDHDAARRSTLYVARQIIWVIFGFVEGLLAIRFILRLLGANPTAGFAQLIYGITAPLIAPFVGLFGTPRFEGSAFEFTTLVAMLVYALLAWVLVKLVWMLFGEDRTSVGTRGANSQF